MRKLLLFTSFIIGFVNANSQAVGIGITSPSSSSMLDISSTTKGMLMPRMTSAQRTAISSPASGLLVFDTDTKTLWAYDGTAWKNLYTSGGVLTLPFSQTVNTAISAFQVTNQGTGAAIEGSSTAQFGTGITAKTTGEGGWGLFAFSNGAGSQSIRSYADNGTAFHGENNNVANTNTLVNLLNKGAGKTGSFQLSNNSSTSPNVQIAGNHLGEQLKIYQTNVLNSASAISIENSGTGEGLYSIATGGVGVYGKSTGNIGVLGESSTGYGAMGTSTSQNGVFGFSAGNGKAGVKGEAIGSNGNGVYGTTTSATGHGVKGFNASGTGILGSSNTSTGVYGSSISGTGLIGYSTSGTGLNTSSINGTGLYTSSTSGLALDVNGNLKISGGNTNPSDGAILTSNASGNATWKPRKVAFSASGYNTNTPTIPAYVYTTIGYQSEWFDAGNDFNTSSANPDPNTFIVPVTGVYHFSAGTIVGISSLTYNILSSEIRLIRNNSTIKAVRGNVPENSPTGSTIQLTIDATVYLNAGDKVIVQAMQGNLNNITGWYMSSEFSGHLVYAE